MKELRDIRVVALAHYSPSIVHFEGCALQLALLDNSSGWSDDNAQFIGSCAYSRYVINAKTFVPSLYTPRCTANESNVRRSLAGPHLHSLKSAKFVPRLARKFLRPMSMQTSNLATPDRRPHHASLLVSALNSMNYIHHLLYKSSRYTHKSNPFLIGCFV